MERREVEKRIYVRKGAAHGFRNLSVIKIPVGFEQPITELKTKFDKTVNTASGCEQCVTDTGNDRISSGPLEGYYSGKLFFN